MKITSRVITLISKDGTKSATTRLDLHDCAAGYMWHTNFNALRRKCRCNPWEFYELPEAVEQCHRKIYPSVFHAMEAITAYIAKR
jgi:hypothetical protein